jgi:hypothetical protein
MVIANNLHLLCAYLELFLIFCCSNFGYTCYYYTFCTILFFQKKSNTVKKGEKWKNLTTIDQPIHLLEHAS